MEACQGIQPTVNQTRIRTSSRKIIRILKIWRGFIPIAASLIWIFINNLPTPMQQEILPEFVRLPLPLPSRLMGFVITMIPIGITLYAITTLIRLFRLYQDGKIFHADSVRCLQILSRTLMTLCFAGIIAHLLMSVALTIHHPQGERMLSLVIKGQDVTLLIVGYILATIARVMQEACQLQVEQDLTI